MRDGLGDKSFRSAESALKAPRSLGMSIWKSDRLGTVRNWNGLPLRSGLLMIDHRQHLSFRCDCPTQRGQAALIMVSFSGLRPPRRALRPGRLDTLAAGGTIP